MVAGMLFRQFKAVPSGSHKGINAWILYIALPAMSFKYLPQVNWSQEMLVPAITPFIVALGGLLAITLYNHDKRLSKETVGGLKIASAFSNTSFVGFPLIMAYYSEKDLGIAIVVDQVGFMLVATLGITTAVMHAGRGRPNMSFLLKKLFTFPPFLGCLAALILPRFLDVSSLSGLFDRLAGTLGPMALFSIGLQLRFNGWREELKPILYVQAYKLLIAPALVLFVACCLTSNHAILRISVFEAAMPSLITSGIIAEEYQLNPRLVNLVIGTGILIGFITTGIWYLILQGMM